MSVISEMRDEWVVLGGSGPIFRTDTWLIISPQDLGLWDPSKWPFMANKTGVILTYELGKILQVSGMVRIVMTIHWVRVDDEEFQTK